MGKRKGGRSRHNPWVDFGRDLVSLAPGGRAVLGTVDAGVRLGRGLKSQRQQVAGAPKAPRKRKGGMTTTQAPTRTLTEFRGGKVSIQESPSGVVVRGTEEIELDKVGNLMLWLAANPAMWPTSNLRSQAVQYLKWKCRDLKVSFMTAKGADTDGTISMGKIASGSSVATAKLARNLVSSGGVKTNIGKNSSLDLKPGDPIWDQWYNIKTEIGNDSNPYSVCVMTDTPSNVAGSLIVEYAYELALPVDPDSGVYTNLGVQPITAADAAISGSTLNIGSILIAMEDVSTEDFDLTPGDMLIVTSKEPSAVYVRAVRASTTMTESEISFTSKSFQVLSWTRNV